jgi:hypothetical protein
MKRSGNVLIYLIVWVIVIFVSFVIGICIREVRFHRARVTIEDKTETTTKVNTKSEKVRDTEQSTPELAEETSDTTEEKEGGQIASRSVKPGTKKAQMNIEERFANMSEEERAQMLEKKDGSGKGKRNISEADRAKFRAEMQKKREEFLNMSEEEKEKIRAERGRLGKRSSGKNGEGDRSQEGDKQNNDNEKEQEGQKEDSSDSAPPPKGRGCFVPETVVLVSGKLVQISKVTTGQGAGKQLCGLWSLEKVEEHEGTFECRDIVLESGNRISVVDAHCFMLESGKWIAAQNLTNGLSLKTKTGTVVIKSVTKRTVPYSGKVYNLKVKGSDRYLVGKDMLIVRDY